MNNRLIQRMLNQVAVYWGPGKKDRQGQQTYNDPVEVPCRWDEVTEQFLDPKTEVLTMSKAKVYVGLGADRDENPVVAAEDGVLWLSTATKTDAPGTALAELTSNDDPFAQTGAYVIRRADKFPNRRANNFLRTCYL